jgi:hypothetical protein
VVEERLGALNALLFHMTFWHLNLAYFDRFPLESWPQTRIGIVLWSLSASADDWLPPERLSRLCAVPINGILESAWDLGSSLMEIRVLRPLVWFGLLDSLKEGTAGSQLADRRLYDRFLNFSVGVERPENSPLVGRQNRGDDGCRRSFSSGKERVPASVHTRVLS